MDPIFSAGPSGHVVLISGSGQDTGGGMLCLDGRAVERIDRVSSSGMVLVENRLLRMLQFTEDIVSAAELLMYDERGIKRYDRLDTLRAPHDVAWDGRHVVVVSSGANSIVWLGPDGEVVREWQAPGEGDAWHLNCVLMHDGEMYASAFGRFRRRREWSERLADGCGIVFNLRTGEDVLTGLSCPHTPRVVDGSWVVCNSYTNELWFVDEPPDRSVTKLPLRSFPRGIAIGEEHLFVGESARRPLTDTGMMASVAVVSRKTREVVERFDLPCQEVYDLVVVPTPLLEGVRRGFRTNPLRVAERDQLALFDAVGVQPARIWAISDPLRRQDCRIKVEAELPTEMEADSVYEIDLEVENLGAAILVTSPPNPVYMSYRWLKEGDDPAGPWIELERYPLPSSLPPGGTTRLTMRLIAPSAEGRYLLRVTALQEMVVWFDNVDVSNARSAWVQIVGREGGDASAEDGEPSGTGATSDRA